MPLGASPLCAYITYSAEAELGAARISLAHYPRFHTPLPLAHFESAAAAAHCATRVDDMDRPSNAVTVVDFAARRSARQQDRNSAARPFL